MRYIRCTLIGSVIALLTATTVQANVIYDWHSTSSGPYVTATDGELVITDAAYRAGSIDFYVNSSDTSPGVHYGNYPNFRITNSPVVSASLNFSLSDDNGDAVPGVGAQPGSQFFSDMQFPFASELTFNSDGTLTGDLSLYDESDQADAGGTHFDWSVGNYASDYFIDGQCTGSITCDGGSGYWQLSSVPPLPIPVPEPPVWLLFGLGVLGLFSLLGLRRIV